VTRQIKTQMRINGPTYAVRLTDKVPELGGIFLTENTASGLQVKLFYSEYQAQQYVDMYNPGTAEVVEYVNEETE